MKTKLPVIISWNLAKLAYQEFGNKYSARIFNNFQFPPVIDSILFLQLCIHHCMEVGPAVMNKIREEGKV